jgi:hypothetical protein
MTERDELTISNVVPRPRDWSATPVHCARCCQLVTPDHTGNFYTECDCWWVCDDCGKRERPDLYDALVQMRRGGAFTVTIGGARIDEDAAAWDCLRCGHQLDEPPDRWHVVDVQHGRPVCADCLLDIDPVVVALCNQLTQFEAEHREHAAIQQER